MSTSTSTKPAKISAIIAIVAGIFLIVAGAATYITVSSTLSAERITVSEDACMAGKTVNGPIDAYCEAMIIQDHALEATGGKTYAELDREDPLRAVAMNGSFLRASLFTSVVAFGVSGLVIGLGVLFILVGTAILNLAKVRGSVTQNA